MTLGKRAIMSAFVGAGIQFNEVKRGFTSFHIRQEYSKSRVVQFILKSANEWPNLVSFQSESNRNFT